MTIWDRIKAGALSLAEHVESVFDSFFSAAAADVAAAGGQLLEQAALAAVTAAETTGGTGAEKLAAAIASVKTSLETQGIPVVEHAVQVGVLAAVSNLKAAQAQVVPAPQPDL